MAEPKEETMAKWNITDFNWFEKFPSSPAAMQAKFSSVIYNSTTCRVKVENVNPTTGEYRVVLTGTYCPDDTTPTQNYNS